MDLECRDRFGTDSIACDPHDDQSGSKRSFDWFWNGKRVVAQGG